VGHRKTVLKTLAVCVVALCIAVFVLEQMSRFEQTGRLQDRNRNRQIGRSVNIGGRTLNIYCSGAGSPAVVFDTFGHMSGYSWNAVQREVARFTRACWYDRAYYGWSDPAPASPRTFRSVASDLHALLHAAAISPPYVLVGGGDAALHIRVYHGMYPNEVAGVVMENANDVDDPNVEIPETAKGPWAKHFGSFAPRVRGAACVFFPILGRTGVARLASGSQNPRPTGSFDLTPEQQSELDFLSDNPTAQQGSELCDREESMQQVRAAGNLGSIPLVVLASTDRAPAAPSAPGSAEAIWDRHQVEQVQPGLARLSSRGRLVLLHGDVTASSIVFAIRDVAGAVTPASY
jgi:hypothetical protein